MRRRENLDTPRGFKIDTREDEYFEWGRDEGMAGQRARYPSQNVRLEGRDDSAHTQQGRPGGESVLAAMNRYENEIA